MTTYLVIKWIDITDGILRHTLYDCIQRDKKVKIIISEEYDLTNYIEGEL